MARLPAGGDTVRATDYRRVPGGKGANQALAARRLGADVALVAAVGDDEPADRGARPAGRRRGRPGRVRRVPDAPTGVALITVDDAGENTIVVVPGRQRPAHRDRGRPGRRGRGALPAGGAGGDGGGRGRGAPAGRALLPEHRAAGPVPAAVLDRADLVVANRAEHAEVDGLDRARLVAVTAGAEGAVLLEGGREVARAAPPAVTAVDGTGAGDAFTGGAGGGPAGRAGPGRGAAPGLRGRRGGGEPARRPAGPAPTRRPGRAGGAS